MGDLIHVVIGARKGLSWMAQPCLESLARHWKSMPDSATVLSNDLEIALPDWAWLRTWSSYQGSESHGFAHSLKELCSEIKAPTVLWLCVDMFLLDDLDERIFILAEYILSHPNVIRAGVPRCPSLAAHHEHLEIWRGLDVIRCNSWGDCSLSGGLGMDFALFDRKMLRDVLHPGWNIVQCEVNGSERARAWGWYGVGIEPALVRRIDLHRSSTAPAVYWHLNELAEEDRRIVQRYQPDGIAWES